MSSNQNLKRSTIHSFLKHRPYEILNCKTKTKKFKNEHIHWNPSSQHQLNITFNENLKGDLSIFDSEYQQADIFKRKLINYIVSV